MKTSYQKRIEERDEARAKANEFERMFKNYIKAVEKNQEEQKQNLINWFKKNSKAYSREV